MVEKIPKWESKLWSYVSSGDGMQCPMYGNCEIMRRGNWCPIHDGEYRVRLQQLVEDDSDNSVDWRNLDIREFPKLGTIFQLVEMLAQKYLRQGKVRQPPVPTELVSLADPERPVEIRTVPLKAYHAAIWCLQDTWVMQLKSDDTAVRKRFALFHEAFHILAHGGGTPVFRKAGLRGGSFNELLADCFAIYILMPEKWVKEKWAEVKSLDGMAEIFGVPKSVMWFRLKLLGLI